jgi:N-ethylmaleimide reductase
MNTPNLFTPVRLGAVEAPNRLVMAPLTRMRAGAGRVPTPLMAEYYAQRAAAGLIITEATAVSQQGTGCPNTPGIYTDEQVAGWQRVTEAVHQGRWPHFSSALAHGPDLSSKLSNQEAGCRSRPAPSPRSPARLSRRPARNLTSRRAPWRKKSCRASCIAILRRRSTRQNAGFDGVEIHNANGYLLDQFLRDGTNHRTDAYGGPVRNRARLTLEVTEAVTKVWGADRVGIRFSPGGVFNDMRDSDPLATFSHVLHELNRFQLAYAHLIVSTEDDVRHGAVPVPLVELRQEFHGPLIVANGFNRATATQALAEDLADAVAFGRLFLANP